MQPEKFLCIAVKHAKRITKRMNKKRAEDSDSDEDDLVRILHQMCR